VSLDNKKYIKFVFQLFIMNNNIEQIITGQNHKGLTNINIPDNDKKSGMFDLPKMDICNDPEHEPPSHICIPQGKGYRHVCPKCGKVAILIPTQISL